MTFPPLGYTGQRIYSAMAPHWIAADAGRGFSMAWLIYALTYRIEPIVSIIRDRGDRPGWADAVDIDAAPDDFLEFIGSMVGVDISTPWTPTRYLATNLCSNPSFEADTVDRLPMWWTIDETESGSQIEARVNRTWAEVDTQSFQWQGTTRGTDQGVELTSGRISLSEGDPLYTKFTVHGVDGDIAPAVTIEWFDLGDSSLGTETQTDWASESSPFTEPVSVAFSTAPVDTAYAIVRISLLALAAGDVDVAIDAIIMSIEDVPYFDGSVFLGQWDGLIGGSVSRLYTPDPSLIEESTRQLIKNAPNHRRATAPYIQYIAQQRLTGSRTAVVTENYQGSPWRVRIVTYSRETPDPDGTARDLEARRPAGYIFDYEVFFGQSYDELQAQYGPTYQDIYDAFDDYRDVLNNLPR